MLLHAADSNAGAYSTAAFLGGEAGHGAKGQVVSPKNISNLHRVGSVHQPRKAQAVLIHDILQPFPFNHIKSACGTHFQKHAFRSRARIITKAIHSYGSLVGHGHHSHGGIIINRLGQNQVRQHHQAKCQQKQPFALLQTQSSFPFSSCHIITLNLS